MSFYGKIYTTIGNAFKRLKFSNTGKSSTTIPATPAEDFIIEAQLPNDYANFESGNQWIGFAQTEEGSAQIYHLQPHTTVSSNSRNTLTNIGAASNKDTVIGLTQAVTINSPTFDTAGHMNGYTQQSYHLDISTVYTKTEADKKIVDTIEDMVYVKSEIDELVPTTVKNISYTKKQTDDKIAAVVANVPNQVKEISYTKAETDSEIQKVKTWVPTEVKSIAYTKAETEKYVADAIDAVPNLTEALEMLETVSDLSDAIGLEKNGSLPSNGLLFRVSVLESTTEDYGSRITDLETLVGISNERDGLLYRTADLETLTATHSNQISNIENLLGLPTNGVYPEDGILFRVSSLETLTESHSSHIEDIENILGISRENGVLSSTLETRIDVIENNIGDLSSVGIGEVSIAEMFGDLSSINFDQEQPSVASLFGDMSRVSAERKNLAEILGNLDEAVGIDKNFAAELGTLQKNVALILKYLNL